MLPRVLLAALSSPLVTSAAPLVEVVPSTAAGEVAKLRCAGLTEPMILQSSADMVKWTDVALITPSFHGVESGIPAGAPTDRAFYRLRALTEPLRLYPNTFPGSPHLAEIVSGRDVEINLFGTRTAEGYPAAVTSIAYRVGNTSYVGTSSGTAPAPAPAAPPSTPPPAVNEMDGMQYLMGLVRVRIDDCPPSRSWVVIQYEASNAEGLITGEVKGEPATTTETHAWYTYKVPYKFTVPGSTRNEVQLRAAHDGLLSFSPASAAPAMTMMLGAAREGTPTAAGTLREMPQAELAALTAGLPGHAGYDLANSPDDYKTLSAALTATQLKLTAMIPNGDYHQVAKSPTITVPDPQNLSIGPELVLDDVCNQGVNFVPVVLTENRDYLRNEFQYFNGGRSTLFRRMEFLEFIHAGGSRSDNDALLTRASASCMVSASSGIDHISFHSDVRANVTETNLEALVSGDGKLTFKVIRGDASGGFMVEAEFVVTGNTAQGRLTQGAQTLHAPTTTGRWIVPLYTGGVYGVSFLNRVSKMKTEEPDFSAVRGAFDLILLGNSRPRGWSESRTAP